MSVTTASVPVHWAVHELHQFCNRLYRTGQAHRIVTPEGIAAVEAIVKEDGLVTVNGIAAHLEYESWISTPYRP
jgi:hypothetical protein